MSVVAIGIAVEIDISIILQKKPMYERKRDREYEREKIDCSPHHTLLTQSHTYLRLLKGLHLAPLQS